MKTVKNEFMKNTKVSTSFGVLEFDAEGCAEMPDEAADSLITLNGYSLVAAQEPPQGDDKEPDEKSITPDKENAPEGDSGVPSDENQENSTNDEEETKETEDEDKESTTTDEAADITKLTVPSLKKMAKDMGIDTSDLTKKDQLIEAITAKTKAE